MVFQSRSFFIDLPVSLMTTLPCPVEPPNIIQENDARVFTIEENPVLSECGYNPCSVHLCLTPLTIFSEHPSLNSDVQPSDSLRFQNVTIRKSKRKVKGESAVHVDEGYKPLSAPIDETSSLSVDSPNTKALRAAQPSIPVDSCCFCP